MGRLLAIDYGQRRCGIAVTDALRIVANGLATVETPKLAAFLKEYISREPVDKIIMGEPRNMDGQPSDSQRFLLPAVGRLRKEFPQVPIEFFDERFTSVLAHRAMLDGGMKRQARREKGKVDEISASIILNDYLNSLQSKQQ